MLVYGVVFGTCKKFITRQERTTKTVECEANVGHRGEKGGSYFRGKKTNLILTNSLIQVFHIDNLGL